MRFRLSIMCLLLLAAGTPAAHAADDATTIRVDYNVYTPGLIPFGFGEKNTVALQIADEWEALHPGLTIEPYTLVLTGNSEGEWLKTQLIGGIAPEIVHMNAEVSWPDVDKGWYVPLDDYLMRPTPYVEGNPPWLDTFTNQALIGAKRAPDGKLYCISIDIVETGLFYNMTLLRKLGINKKPETWAQWLRMMNTIKAAHITPMTGPNNLASDWGQDILFEMLYHDILPLMDMTPSRPDAQGYLGHYLDPPEAGFLYTKGFFTPRDPRWRELYRLLHEWRQCWAMEQKNSDWLRLFLTGRMAILWDGSWSIRRMTLDPYIDFEWEVGYLPPLTKETSPFAAGTPAAVIGGAAVQLHITNSAIRKGLVDQCVDYLMFITAPQNMQRLAAEARAFIPNVRGVQVDEHFQAFQDIFTRPYCAIKWLDSLEGEYKKYFRRMLDYYLHDGAGLDEFLAMLEQNFAGWVQSHRNDRGWDFAPMEEVWKQREAQLLNQLQSSPADGADGK